MPPAQHRTAPAPPGFTKQDCEHVKPLNSGKCNLGTHDGKTVCDLFLSMVNLSWMPQGSGWATIKCLQATGQFVPEVYCVLGLCSFAFAAQIWSGEHFCCLLPVPYTLTQHTAPRHTPSPILPPQPCSPFSCNAKNLSLRTCWNNLMSCSQRSDRIYF